jgi:hypothetical protein
MGTSGCRVAPPTETEPPPATPEVTETVPKPEPIDLPRHPPDESRRSFAILALGADLRRAPQADVPVTEYEDDQGPRVVEVLGRTEGFVEIGTAFLPAGRHCHEPLSNGLALHLFVEEEDLELVVSETITRRLDDAAVVLAPGNLVQRDQRGYFVEGPSPGWRAAFPTVQPEPDYRWRGGLQTFPNTSPTRFDLDEGDLGKLGRSYIPASEESAPTRDEPLADDSFMTIDGRGIPLWALDVYARRSTATGEIALAGDLCVQVMGLVDHHPEGHYRTGGGGGPHCRQMSLSRPSYEIEAGTPLQWAEGGPAGTTSNAWTTTIPPKRARGKRLCFDPTLGCTNTRELRFCVPADAVTEHEPSWPLTWGKPRANAAE